MSETTQQPSPARQENENGQEITVRDRLQMLHEQSALSYYEIARMMGVTRTTVHAVLKQQRKPSKKFVARFEDVERRLEQAAIARVAGTKPESLLIIAAQAKLPEPEFATPADKIELKTKCVELVDPGQTLEVSLRNPGAITGLRNVLKALLADQCEDLLFSCLPPQFATTAFIEKLTPTSFLYLLQKCLRLVMGDGWRDELQTLAKRTVSARETQGHPSQTAQAA